MVVTHCNAVSSDPRVSFLSALAWCCAPHSQAGPTEPPFLCFRPWQVALQDIQQAQAEQQVLQVQADSSVQVARSLATIESTSIVILVIPSVASCPVVCRRHPSTSCFLPPPFSLASCRVVLLPRISIIDQPLRLTLISLRPRCLFVCVQSAARTRLRSRTSQRCPRRPTSSGAQPSLVPRSRFVFSLSRLVVLSPLSLVHPVRVVRFGLCLPVPVCAPFAAVSLTFSFIFLAGNAW